MQIDFNCPAAYLAPEGFIDELTQELGGKLQTLGRLIIPEQPVLKQPAWIQNIWFNPVVIPISSISSAVKQLKTLNKRWANYSYHLYRRSELIQQQLPALKNPPLQFLQTITPAKLGSWTLLDEKHMLVSPHCSSPFPNGESYFQENKTEPPSRAYLKLWELFTLYSILPKPGELCLDLGSSPGGWTWVLEQMQCKVISVDKAPLAPQLLKSSRIKYLNKSAFSIIPDEIGPIDWLFADIACYPRRLLNLIKNWLQSGLCQRLICTIKLQGATDFKIIKEFEEIPHSRLIHLFHNKHELTWINLSPTKPSSKEFF